MVILITGVKGLLGKYLIKTQPLKDCPEGVCDPLHEVIPCGREDLDLNDPISKLFKIQPDIIIHCAANGDVDSVENNPAEAVRSDLLATINLMEYCEKMDCKLVTISTNAVYDGEVRSLTVSDGNE